MARSRSIQSPSIFLTRNVFRFADPTGWHGDVWRLVAREPINRMAQQFIVRELSALKFIITGKDKDDPRPEEHIDRWQSIFERDHGFDTWISRMVMDVCTLPFGAASEVGHTKDGELSWVVHVDGATLLPTYEKAVPYVQVNPDNWTQRVYFKSNQLARMMTYARPDLRFKEYQVAATESGFLEIEALSKIYLYYMQQLTDTPPPGILDVMDMTSEDATEWAESFRDTLEGVDPIKIPLLTDHTLPAKFIPFGRSPQDLNVVEQFKRFAEMLLAKYGLSIGDLRLFEHESTKAGERVSQMVTERSGIGYWASKLEVYLTSLLAKGLKFAFKQPRPERELIVAQRQQVQIANLQSAAGGKQLISVEDAVEEAVALEIFTTDIKPVEEKEEAPAVPTNGTGSKAETPKPVEVADEEEVKDLTKSVYKGGPGSGHHGHGGRPGHRGGSGRGGGSAIPTGKWMGGQVWQVARDQSLPSEALKSPALILMHPDGSLTVATNKKAKAFGSLHHAELAHHIGASTTEFDSMTRTTFTGEQFIIASAITGTGGKTFRSDSALDRFAQKKIRALSNTLLGAGYEGETTLAWYTARVGPSVKLPIEEWKAELVSDVRVYSLHELAGVATKAFVSKALDGDWMLPAEPIEGRFEDLLLGVFQQAGQAMPERKFGRELEDVASGESVEKGGPGSGNFGHTGRPGHRGGSAGVAVGTIQLDGERPLYSINPKMGEKFPYHENESGLLLVSNGIIHYVPFEAGGAVSGTHADMAAEMGIDSKEYDEAFRATFYRGSMSTMSDHTGLGNIMDIDPDAIDSIAYKNIKRNVRILLRAGIPGDVSLEWETDMGEEVETQLIDYKALHFKGFTFTLLELIEGSITTAVVSKGGSGSGNFGHTGRVGQRGGSAGIATRTTVDSAIKKIRKLTLSGGAIGNIEFSPEERAFLAKTVERDSYTLYRGIGLVKGRTSEENLQDARGLTAGSKTPGYLMKQHNPYASYTTKKSIARIYSEGKVSLILSAKVGRKDVVVDTRNLRKVLRKVGHEDIFDAADYDYFKGEGEVIVKEPVSSTIMSVKG